MKSAALALILMSSWHILLQPHEAGDSDTWYCGLCFGFSVGSFHIHTPASFCLTCPLGGNLAITVTSGWDRRLMSRSCKQVDLEPLDSGKEVSPTIEWSLRTSNRHTEKGNQKGRWGLLGRRYLRRPFIS